MGPVMQTCMPIWSECLLIESTGTMYQMSVTAHDNVTRLEVKTLMPPGKRDDATVALDFEVHLPLALEKVPVGRSVELVRFEAITPCS